MKLDKNAHSVFSLYLLLSIEKKVFDKNILERDIFLPNTI